MRRTWNILCPGPSAPHVQSSDLLAGPLVAVNAAIRTPLHVDYWCALDGPLRVLANVPEETHAAPWGEQPPPVLWTRRSRYILPDVGWQAIYPELKADVAPDGWEFTDTVPARGPDWLLFTSLAATAFALCRGAQRIRVLGADLRGVGHWDAVTDRAAEHPGAWSSPIHVETADAWWSGRLAREREQWDIVRLACQKIGVAVEMATPRALREPTGTQDRSAG